MDYTQFDVESYEERKGPLFDSESYLDIEDNPELSLQLLINCVYVCTCTILHERKLIPEKSFRAFKVYDDVNGYLVDESDRNGLFVTEKYAMASQQMFAKKLSKFAIVVQTDEKSSPIEAFVWHFNFDDPNGTSVRLGLNGQESTKFTVHYKNMSETCKQFCQMFSTLRKILDDLSPLPEKTVPSFRLAHFGDVTHVNGYDSVNEFVDLQQFLIGVTRLPREQITMTYGSNFQNHVTEENFENSTMMQGKSVLSEIQKLEFERTRAESISGDMTVVSPEQSHDDNLLSIPDSALNDIEIERPNIEIDNMDVDNICSDTDEISQVSTEFSTHCNPASENIEESVETHQKLNKKSKRNTIEKPLKNDVFALPEQEGVLKKPRKASRRLTVVKQVTFADQTISPNTIEPLKQPIRIYGRVPSLSSLSVSENNKKNMSNFGRVRTLKNLLEESNDQKNVKKSRKSDEPEKQRKQTRYAKTSSIL